MKFFADTADIADIRDLAETGLIDGVTTNPSLIHKSGRDFIEVTKEICGIVDGPVSAEVVALDHETMMKEADKLRKIADNGHRLHELTERLVRMEGHADDIHAAGLKRVYKASQQTEPLHFIVRQEMFKRLERVVDRFEDLANEIDGLVIDHA